MNLGLRLSINDDRTLSTHDPLAGGDSIGIDPGSSHRSAKVSASARHRRINTTTKYQFMKLATTDMASIERKLDSIRLTDLQNTSINDSLDRPNESWDPAQKSRRFSPAAKRKTLDAAMLRTQASKESKGSKEASVMFSGTENITTAIGSKVGNRVPALPAFNGEFRKVVDTAESSKRNMGANAYRAQEAALR